MEILNKTKLFYYGGEYIQEKIKEIIFHNVALKSALNESEILNFLKKQTKW